MIIKSLVGRWMFVAKFTQLNDTCTSIQSCILDYFNKNFILSYLSYLCGSNEHNFVLNGALLTEIFIIYYVFTNLTTTQSILTRFLRLNTRQIALINVYTKSYQRPVQDRFFCGFLIWKTGLGLGPCPGGSKDWTRPDFQTLKIDVNKSMVRVT